MPYTPKELLTWYEALKTTRGNFETQWQRIADNMIGRRNFIAKTTPGQDRNWRIFDTTAFESLELLSSALHSMLTNTEARWFGISLEDPELSKHPDAALWLEQSTNLMRVAFSRPNANFTPQAHELYFDLVAFGTGNQFISNQEGEGAFFSTRPLSECYLSENVAGIVDTVFRCFEMTARQAFELFGEDDLPEEAVKAFEDGKFEQKAEYLHVVLPNPQIIPGNVDWTGMPFVSFHIDIRHKAFIGDIRGFWEMPYQTPRWEKDSGEIYGRGPGMVALPDVMMLNEMSRTTLKGAQKAVDPPSFVPNDGILSNIHLAPGGVTVVDAQLFRESRGQPVTWMPQSSNVNLGVEMENRRATQIRRAFHHELLQMFEDPRMTATQVLELSRTAQRMLSPVLGRQRVEYLEPMIERVFGIMLRAGQLPPIPDVLGGQSIKIDYISPVARAQKADEAGAVTRVLSQAMEASSVDPTVMDNFDLDVAFRFIAESNSIPSTILRDPRLVQAIRQQRAEQQEAQRKFEQAQQAAETGARLIPAVAKAEQLQAEAA
jgi:hypothetical protein